MVISKNNIISIVQTDTQEQCSSHNTWSRDIKNIKSVPFTVTNLTAVNSETKSQKRYVLIFCPIL